MKLIRAKSLLEVETSHLGIKKKVLLQNDYIPQLTGLNKTKLMPGQEVGGHAHKTMFEVFYILSGKVLFSIDNSNVELGFGDCISIDPGETHSLKNESSKKVEFIYFGIATD